VAPFDNGDFQATPDSDGTWSPWFGYGRVDAQAAVAEALRTHPPTPTGTIRKNAKPETPIPDNISPGISSTIYIDEDVTIADVSVRVDISHTYIGDLFVKLVAPSGTVCELHKRTRRRTQDLKRAYTLNDTNLHLGALLGESVRGV
jgi:subtilisin-like proprotein convertase family protein